MKICPQCQQTYSDDSLNFCLEDGSVLSVAPAQQAIPKTVVMNEPRITHPQPPAGVSQSALATNWQQPQQYSMQPPKKSSKTWIWVVGILGALVLLCGGSSIVGYLLLRNIDTETASNSSFTPTKLPTKTSNSSNAPTTADSPSTSGRDELTTVDLNMFVQKFSVYGTTVMSGDELTMGSISKDYYYVLVAPDKDSEDEPVDKYKTDDTDVRVTVRNFANADSRFGYGLVFHSNPQPLQQDYAFLIDTKRKKYRIVHHEPQKETAVKNWTASPLINGGTEENTLEIHDLPDKIELYINGTIVTSIQNIYGYSGGVVGLYSGDGAKIVFKDLEIRR